MTEGQPALRVYVVAAVRLHRDGLAVLLSRHPGVEIVGTAKSWTEGAVKSALLKPDVVLLDMALADGPAAIGEIVHASGGTKVVALAVSEADGDVISYAEAGVSGFVTRDESLDDLVAAIESAARDQVTCSPRITAALLRHVAALATPAPVTARLTRREAEIATLLRQGLTNKEIAQRLCIELATVKNHVHNILEKLQVRSRFEVRGQHEPRKIQWSGSAA